MILQTFTFEGMPDGVARDAFVASGMEHGVREGYERLDAVLGQIE